MVSFEIQFHDEKSYPYQKRLMCYKTPTKQNIYFSSYPLSWPIFGLFCHKAPVTCIATLTYYEGMYPGHLYTIRGTKRMLRPGRSSTCRTLLCLHWVFN